MRAMSCEFCERTFRGDVMFDDDTAMIILHEDWAVRGHAMVVSKSHVENVSALDPGRWERFAEIYREAEKILLQLTGADRAIILKLGIMTPHLHLHIYPVSAALDRADVMKIIDGKMRKPRNEQFVDEVRATMSGLP